MGFTLVHDWGNQYANPALAVFAVISLNDARKGLKQILTLTFRLTGLTDISGTPSPEWSKWPNEPM
jgi:hypothetical protein